jgi:hypothetical protein
MGIERGAGTRIAPVTAEDDVRETFLHLTTSYGDGASVLDIPTSHDVIGVRIVNGWSRVCRRLTRWQVPFPPDRLGLKGGPLGSPFAFRGLLTESYTVWESVYDGRVEMTTASE